MVIDLSMLVNTPLLMGAVLILSGIGVIFKTYSDSIALASIIAIIAGVLIAGSASTYTKYKPAFAIVSILLGTYIAGKGRNWVVVLLGIVMALLSLLMIIF